MKDFLHSYEQRAWKLAAKQHQEWKDFLNKYPDNPALHKRVGERLAYYEKRFPQLKKPIGVTNGL